MTKSTLLSFTRIPAMLLVGLSLAAAPALAEKGGNGNGGGNGGSRSESSAGGGKSKSEKTEKAGKNQSGKTSEDDDEDTDDMSDTGATARAAGKLNGFLHASPRAIARASDKSALGRVVSEYGNLLGDYISPDEGETAPTAGDLADALENLANKPVTADDVAAVNAKLLAVDTELQADLDASGKTIADINAEISGSLTTE
jgi:hypothetical protein